MPVELKRINSDIFREKPKVFIHNKHIKRLKQMGIGEKGHLNAMLRVTFIEQVKDEHETERLEYVLKIEKGDVIDLIAHKEFK